MKPHVRIKPDSDTPTGRETSEMGFGPTLAAHRTLPWFLSANPHRNRSDWETGK